MKQHTLENIRADFPVLNQTAYGKPLVYLDNAASTQKPVAVLEAMNRYYRSTNANVHRGNHLLSDQATEQFEAARETVRGFINAASREEVIWTKGTTEAINLVANGIRQQLREGDEIIVSHMEHHANIVPWQILCDEKSARLRVVELLPNGMLDLSHLRALLNENTRLLAITHVSNVLGIVNPVKEIVKIAHQADVPVLLDGAQAVGHDTVDVQAIDCDYYVFSGHKLFGPTGIGVLYGKQEQLEMLTPLLYGGEMIEQVSFSGTRFTKLPYRLEAGTPAIAEAIGLAAAIDYFNGIDKSWRLSHEHRLREKTLELARSVTGLRIIGEGDDAVSVISFLLEGMHHSDVGTLLDKQGIGIRTGHHCAMPLMEKLGIDGTARASFAFYNSESEVEKLFEALKYIQKRFT